MKSNQGMVEATASGSPPRRGNAEDPVVLLVRAWQPPSVVAWLAATSQPQEANVRTTT
jgi:hypothetical protein